MASLLRNHSLLYFYIAFWCSGPHPNSPVETLPFCPPTLAPASPDTVPGPPVPGVNHSINLSCPR
ncbi:hypothetical protein SERLA73DRAFT_176462 [Serpula lacrymans var. lacrymans S7.3]|uniref:Uncharacterized protein n=2 Tax=Serpula lacrymans var. lacrymans TaxID=341189 RepID=F8PN06_SERL3|nr:uncharacterized protein SERLADRAFT_459330 [Serpula lacrymans var. lacrymans S7.9]EGO02988.1 hypothetical protein SERLA73DRAFT_176462 [Serpula lacrymans var. lacrymans S7.3]EGO28669.1 hypothetical protein SERLADRAFT_459330 [Serpula lacrymans var. lacrymans S7.9]